VFLTDHDFFYVFPFIVLRIRFWKKFLI